MDQIADVELLERAQHGDGAAFGALVRRHDRYLYRVARSVLRDDSDAEDAVQQSFLQAFAKLANFRGEANLRTWLTRIVINEATRRRRRRRSTVELGQIDTAQERARSEIFLKPLGDTPESAAARGQIRHMLERAIDDLPPAFRTVLVMRDVEEASVEETATTLGLKPETVRTRLHRARHMLREKIGDELETVLKDVFPFERPRCDALVREMGARIGLSRQALDQAVR